MEKNFRNNERRFNNERKPFRNTVRERGTRPHETAKVSKFDKYKNDTERKNNYKKEDKSEYIVKEVKDDRVYFTDNPDLVYDKGVKVRLEFSALSHEAHGIAKINGVSRKGLELTNYPIFVPGVLPGEKANVEIVNFKKTFAEGKLLEIKFSNKEKRAVPICPHYNSCGGCDLMHMTYPAQLEFKRQTVIDTLAHLGGISGVEVDTTIGMDDPNHYRNKVQVPYNYHNNKTICGFYKKNTHQIISLDNCFIQSTLASDIVKFIRNICNELRIKGYIEETHDGTLRHVMIRENKKQDEIMVVLVTKTKNVLGLNDLVSKLVKRYPNITSVIQNVNEERTNVVLGNTNIVLHGNNAIIDELLGVKFRIGPMSFYQVNSIQTEKLYQTAIDKANLSKDDVLIDAYCGIGTIGLIAAKHVKKVYGVEIVPEAIENANVNKELNNIKNAEFVCAKAEDQIVKWSKSRMKPTVIIVDPPRKGCEESFLETVVNMNIPKMVYVSCNPATLARDLKYMVEHNYEIKTVSPVDMFPNSNHVETVVSLIKK